MSDYLLELDVTTTTGTFRVTTGSSEYIIVATSDPLSYVTMSGGSMHLLPQRVYIGCRPIMKGRRILFMRPDIDTDMIPTSKVTNITPVS